MYWVPYTHFPARGRKPEAAPVVEKVLVWLKFLIPISPQGDGNKSYVFVFLKIVNIWRSLYPFPRKGTETVPWFNLAGKGKFMFLIPISPQGDGNSPSQERSPLEKKSSLYPFPRKGTETPYIVVYSVFRHQARSLYPFPRKGTET